MKKKHLFKSAFQSSFEMLLQRLFYVKIFLTTTLNATLIEGYVKTLNRNRFQNLLYKIIF